MDLNPINVVDIDEGKLRKSIDDHLSMIAKDVVRRVGKTAARKVKVEISIAPSDNDEHDVREATIDWKVDFVIPGKKGSTSKAAIEDGLILVNPWDGADPRQTIIPEVKEAGSQEEPIIDRRGETVEVESNVEKFPIATNAERSE
ncbi:hypothetical protein LCGC14_1425820 [marine sediment metagenome]|uniref:Uncharacterized protein n=1 Tax=marine sediment metagenome TaxID=412755 RepID=A0A0F9M5I8_9ZZZZ